MRLSSRRFLSIAAMAAFLLGPTIAQQGWVQWSGNGHWYLAVRAPGNIRWADADAKARELGGVLATIGSAAENQFVYSLISDRIFWRTVQNPTRVFGPWLGGWQPPGSVEPRGGWRWVTTLPWGYTNWASQEPNNFQGMQEDRVHFFRGGSVPGDTWNDLSALSAVPGFVVESDVAPTAAATTLGAGCAPAGLQVPALAPVLGSLPRLGATFRLQLDGYPANAQLAVVAIGLSNRYTQGLSGAVPLPISLAGVGWVGCSQLVSADASTFHSTVNPVVFHDFVVPNQVGLLGLPFFFQGLVATPAQPLFSASVLAVVGS